MAPRLSDFAAPAQLADILRRARREDLGPQGRDLTSRLLIPARQVGRAVFRARQAGRLSGAALLPMVARAYDRRLRLRAGARDGDALHAGDAIAEVDGPLRGLLAMERVALNLLMRLSGVATHTDRFVRAVRGTSAVICDTRKTTPGLRCLEKYAVACGGGVSHRWGLYDAVLVKDNHLAQLSAEQLAPAVAAMVARARRLRPRPRFVQVEVDSLDQLRPILALPAPARPNMVLLDNMNPARLRQAVAWRDRLAPGLVLEASGGVSLRTVAAIARAGVDRISVGALTHSAPALDIGLDLDPA